ncbi:MAG: M14 family metallopeptidase [Pseudomonadota bacterium]
MLRRSVAVVFALLLITTARAEWQPVDQFWPGADYDPSVPTFNEVLGYAPGERITKHADAIRYFEALKAAAPDRVTIQSYAESWQGRRLIYVVISSADNMARQATIRDGMQKLRDAGNTSATEAAAIIEDQPAVTWLSYGVHGNEISGTDAAMMTAYHLLAARGDDRVEAILRETVVVIDPMQNPDGRDRFIHQYTTALGLLADSDRLSAEQDEPWPGGRTNHYYFDLNRDWFILSQPETRGRVRIIQEWLPVAFVDAHEMGSDSTYYFAPEAIPYNPHLAADQRASLTLFGKTNAGWFDRFGIDYFTREVYDAFYPGYGASWPSYFGSVAMTYEQASTRGLKFRQYDGNEVHYSETVRNQFVTSMGTAETVSRHREKLLTDFYDYQVSAIAEGRAERTKSWIIPTQADQAGADKLAGLLVQQGVRITKATDAFGACGSRYEPGSYVIELAQPAKRLIRTLMDQDVPIDEAFMQEQERRRAKDLYAEIYDVTAWSLPLMMNVQADACGRVPRVNGEPAGPVLTQPGRFVATPGDAVVFLVPWGEAPAVRLLSHALREGKKVKTTDKAFTHQGTRYPAGTLIFDAADNDAELAASLREWSAILGADVVAVNDTWVTDGPNFGSGNVMRFSDVRVAMAWDEPTSVLSAGNTRFVIERQFDYPVTPIRTDRLARADLRRYQVLILPTTRGSYADRLGTAGIENLKDWVSDGGVLIALGNASRFLADPDVDLISSRLEDAIVEEDEDIEVPERDDDAEARSVAGSVIDDDGVYRALIQPEAERPDDVPGVLVRAVTDPDHWLGAGVAESLYVLVRGRDIFTPVTLDNGVNVVRFAGADELLASGYLWEQNRKQLAYKPFAIAERRGRGQVVAFTQDPTVRAYLDGLNVLVMNAIFRGAAHARPVR